MPSGVIYLYSKDEDLLQHRAYSGKVARNEVMKIWKRMYGVLFKKCFIQIAPEENDNGVNEDTGQNKYQKIIKHPETGF